MTAVEKDTVYRNFHTHSCVISPLYTLPLLDIRNTLQILIGVSHINRIFNVPEMVYGLHRTVNLWNWLNYILLWICITEKILKTSIVPTLWSCFAFCVRSIKLVKAMFNILLHIASLSTRSTTLKFVYPLVLSVYSSLT